MAQSFPRKPGGGSPCPLYALGFSSLRVKWVKTLLNRGAREPCGGPSRRPAQTPAGLPAIDPAAGRIIIQDFRPVASEGHVSRGRGQSLPFTAGCPQHGRRGQRLARGPGTPGGPWLGRTTSGTWGSAHSPPGAPAGGPSLCPPSPAAVSGAVVDPLQPPAHLMHAGCPLCQALGQTQTPGVDRPAGQGQTCWQVPAGSSSTCPARAATRPQKWFSVRGTLPGRTGAGHLL